ncbi:MBL fold metallo-hydrolase [Brenneria rubrifaciens]|uniref:MBL fold metallo-hydrolase n=1 Tax=Brenneria rubrifaciens TaxID=55213 RepID=A0A4P8QV97_9GAMM|nr:MBL fold metallo-hydrolase [Brenneria rubrifaciens]QCR09450.1 MBL fold metallo-hydrolase [Brenneria rubrifaciens]
MTLLKPLTLLLLAFACSPAFTQAQTVAQVKTQPGYYRLMLGQFEITALSDGTNTLPMDKLLTRISPEKINQLLAEKSLTSPVETSINAYLINTGKNLILVDTGNGKQANPSVGHLLNNLQAAGYRPEQVDTLLLTHLHGDHIGGLLNEGKLAYPNATVYVNERETDYWLSEENLKQAKADRKPAFQRAQAIFRPIIAANKLKTFSGDETLHPGIVAQPALGHTPGHTAYRAESDGKKMLLWGDTVHAEAVQMALPATTISFDYDMDAAAKTRAKLLADAANQGFWVASSHISFPGIGHIKAAPGNDGYRWVMANYSLTGLAN